MQIGFAGSPSFAATVLSSLLHSDRSPSVVFTQPPRAAGRGRRIIRTPVHQLALDHSIKVLVPQSLKGLESEFRSLDVLVVAAYGLILPRAVINAPRLDCINVHASLLPRWRGASPVEHAILHGDNETGVAIMRIVPELDAGPVYRTASIELTGSETTDSVSNELATLGAKTLIEVLEEIECGTAREPVPQDPERVTYAPRLTTDHARLDWTRSATQLERQIRAFIDRSPAFTMQDQLRMRILEAQVVEGTYEPGSVVRKDRQVIIGCGSAGLLLTRVQLNQGKGTPMLASVAANGFPHVFAQGARFA